ncbi:MAG: methionyl-tRNA formyltransferase [Candidatus Omnitrophica bacterium]|nr:methionyl-tRNA formyltransferase [Candidatus Omnitrophota bacterium]
MKIIFFGSADFGIPCLDYLKETYELIAVITNPDRPKGRHLKLQSTPIKQWAEKTGIRIFQPEDLSAQDFIETLKFLNSDMIILISYGKILPREILDVPGIGAFNLHPSLLPEYRGAAPIEWTLVNGENRTGITVIKMEKGVDKGNIIIQEEIPVENTDNYYTLKEKLMEKSSEILGDAIEKISSGFAGFPQKGKSSYAPRLKKEDGHIRWANDASIIHNLVRGLIHWPGAFSELMSAKGKKILKLKETEIEKHEGVYGVPGSFISIDNSIKVACGKGIIRLKRLQTEGKKEMSSEEFLHGYSAYLRNSILR